MKHWQVSGRTKSTLLICLLAAGGIAAYLLSPRSAPINAAKLDELRRELAQKERDSSFAVWRFVPKIVGRIDDLNLPADEILRSLPGVVDVKIHRTTDKPEGRLIHIRDWHFVPK